MDSEAKTKPRRTPRRRDTAAAGGTFLSRYDLMQRWGCVMTTVMVRIKEGNIPEYVFNEKSVRYKLADVEAFENKALAAGFLKRGEQLKQLKAEGAKSP